RGEDHGRDSAAAGVAADVVGSLLPWLLDGREGRGPAVRYVGARLRGGVFSSDDRRDDSLAVAARVAQGLLAPYGDCDAWLVWPGRPAARDRRQRPEAQAVLRAQERVSPLVPR